MRTLILDSDGTAYSLVIGGDDEYCSLNTPTGGSYLKVSDNVTVDNFRNFYVSGGELCEYTYEELNAIGSLPRGWTWQMPERRAVDLRTDEQRKLDAQQDAITRRVALYPPQSQFADAMYWASRGKPELLEKYYADIDLVKATVPKVE